MSKHDHNCDEVFALLSDYLNLELPPEACLEVEAHLAGCDPCVEFAESLRKTVDLCRQYRARGNARSPDGAGARRAGSRLEARGRSPQVRVTGVTAKGARQRLGSG